MNQATLFPFAGRSFVVKYSDELVFRNTYSSDGTTITAEFLAGDMAGEKMSMPFLWQALEGDNFLLSWQEENKSTVVHCDNFKGKTTKSFYTMMDGSFFVMEGLITE
jgi:hypothetical protein